MQKTAKKTTTRKPHRVPAKKKETPAIQSEAFKILSLALKVEEWARHHNLSFGAAVEKAFNDLVEKDQPQETSFLKALESLPEDDEPVTDEDIRCIEQALKEEKAGETIPIEEVMKKYGRQR